MYDAKCLGNELHDYRTQQWTELHLLGAIQQWRWFVIEFGFLTARDAFSAVIGTHQCCWNWNKWCSHRDVAAANRNRWNANSNLRGCGKSRRGNVYDRSCAKHDLYGERSQQWCCVFIHRDRRDRGRAGSDFGTICSSRSFHHAERSTERASNGKRWRSTRLMDGRSEWRPSIQWLHGDRHAGRVDLYDGECTFLHHSGTDQWHADDLHGGRNDQCREFASISYVIACDSLWHSLRANHYGHQSCERSRCGDLVAWRFQWCSSRSNDGDRIR